MSVLQPVPLIVKAIEETRMIRLIYHRKERILEPHDHGILNGSVQLLEWQTAGSSSRPVPNWLLMKTDEISELILLDEIFSGGRPTHKGEHIRWDVLFIRVKSAAHRWRAAG
jgi:hypothetical protein